MFRHKLNLFYSPDDNSGIALDTPDKILNFLNTDDEPTEEIDLTPKKKEVSQPETEEKPETEDEVIEEEDELDEIEDELNEPEVEDENLEELVTPVSRKEILKKYPNLEKDFPMLFKSYYREREFTQIYPTLEDARIAQTKSNQLDTFERQLLSGDTTQVLASLKQEDSNAFNRVVDNYLENLGKVDKSALSHVLTNVSKEIIRNIYKVGKESDNEVLQNTAAILNQFLFGSTQFSGPTKLSKEEKPENNEREQEFTKKQQEFEERRFTSARDSVSSRVQNLVKRTIDTNIDPKNTMTDFVKRHASKEVLDTVYENLEKDRTYKALLDKLWKHAYENDYNSEALDRIARAAIARAKTILPPALKKARIEALKGMGKRVRESADENDNEPEAPAVRPRKTASSLNSGQNNNPPRRAKTEIPKGMSNKDFIMSD